MMRACALDVVVSVRFFMAPLSSSGKKEENKMGEILRFFKLCNFLVCRPRWGGGWGFCRHLTLARVLGFFSNFVFLKVF